ncbi:hypothetical protein J437_LFUL018092 [Ladona fulva]|uniref:receptor protein-tyrosine kinase n=1 Tax=Ladona fulva TaxID=123851 RepID=A0A8K0KRM0_LADFU|nr:hypothetical protein J437_LFUL018092 [Ladona fulva]
MLSATDSKGDWDNFIAGNEESCPRKCPGCSRPHCWTSQHCQWICPDYCGVGVNGSTFCCHNECIGGCKGPRASDCFACQHVTHQVVCLSTCPKGTYRHHGNRCVSQEECFSIFYDNPLLEKDGDEDVLLAMADEGVRAMFSVGVKRSWMIPFECMKECPSGTEEDTESRPCRGGACRKRCQGANVDSISSAQSFRGCTHVDSSLEIVLRELKEDFGQIEEISRYLEDRPMEKPWSRIVVLDNLNLRRLWEWETRNGSLMIGNGQLFFHFNPQLCLSEIEKLCRMANLGEHTHHEVNSASNSNRGDCYHSERHAHVMLKSLTVHFDLNNQSLLGYTIHYIEVLENETAPEDSETCGRSLKVDLRARTQPVEPLPFTQYAYYIKTYILASERRKTKYFSTPPSRPSMPLQFIADKISESSIKLTWKPPLRPNKNITHYIVIGKLQVDDERFLQQRDYCMQPMEFANILITLITTLLLKKQF